MDKASTKKTIKNNTDKKKKSGIKTYIRNFLLFVDKNLMKKIGILCIVALVVVAICIGFVIKITMASECEGVCSDGGTIISNYWSYFKLLGISVISGIVPYIYLPAVAFLACVMQELSNFAYVIKGYGYALGTGLGIIPLILNILVAAIVAALGIYICRNITIGYRITNLKNMNVTNFKIKTYEIFGKKEKAEKLINTRNSKIEALEAKKEKLNLLQILNVSIVVCILQFISVLIQQIAL